MWERKNAGWALWPSLLAGMLAGIAIGLLNGAIVIITKANPFLVTLGTQTQVYAVALILTEAKTWYGKLPEFNVLRSGYGLFGFLTTRSLSFLGRPSSLNSCFEIPSRGTISMCSRERGSGTPCGHSRGPPQAAGFCLLRIHCRSGRPDHDLDVLTARGQRRRRDRIRLDHRRRVGGNQFVWRVRECLPNVIGVLVLGILNNVMVLAGVAL